MKNLLITILTLFVLTSQAQTDSIASSIEVNFYAPKYGYRIDILEDKIYVTGKYKIESVRIIAKESTINYVHPNKRQYNLVIPVAHLPKGYYIIGLSINNHFVVNRYNHHVESKKPKP